MFLFESPQSANAAPSAPKEEISLVRETIKKGADNDKEEKAKMNQAEIERLYLSQAAAYLEALPNVENVAVQTLKAVSFKLRNSYSRDTKLGVDEIEKLKARYAFAILQYVNKAGKNDDKTVTADSIKKVLQDNDGNMLVLYAKLVEEKCLSHGDIDDIIGLCRLILDILPKADPCAPATSIEPKPAATATIETKQMSKDPMDNAKAWPSREKRENRKQPF
jgi:hypothetical protein